MDRLSHGQQDVSTTPRREAEIRHHERQLCAIEMLMLSDDREFWYTLTRAGALREAAGRIARREVA